MSRATTKLQKHNETLKGRKQRLTWGFADVSKVRAAAVGGETVLVTPAADHLIVKRRVAAIPARRGDNNGIWRATQHAAHYKDVRSSSSSEHPHADRVSLSSHQEETLPDSVLSAGDSWTKHIL